MTSVGMTGHYDDSMISSSSELARWWILPDTSEIGIYLLSIYFEWDEHEWSPFMKMFNENNNFNSNFQSWAQLVYSGATLLPDLVHSTLGTTGATHDFTTAAFFPIQLH